MEATRGRDETLLNDAHVIVQAIKENGRSQILVAVKS